MFEDGPIPGLKEMCCLSDDINDYFFPSQGKLKVDSIDDNEELEFTDAAFDTLGFTKTEKDDAWKLTAAIMHLGEMTFKTKGREEGCEPDDLVPGENVSWAPFTYMGGTVGLISYLKYKTRFELSEPP